MYPKDTGTTSQMQPETFSLVGGLASQRQRRAGQETGKHYYQKGGPHQSKPSKGGKEIFWSTALDERRFSKKDDKT